MTPEDPQFKPRFIRALNLKLKKHLPKGKALLLRDRQNMIAAIGQTVLQEMGVKNYSVALVVRSRRDTTETQIGVIFKKLAPSLPAGMKIERKKG